MKDDKDRILVVDDERFNRNVLADLLKPDYTVVLAKSGQQALEKAASDNPPDLILLDIMMPEMDGYEVCEKLKSNSDTRTIPVIFVTAMQEVEDEAKGLGIGAIDYITKPFSPSIVKARVRNHMELKRAREHLARQNKALHEAARLKEDVERMTRHDLKTPLNAVIGVSQALTDDEALPKQFVESLNIVQDAGYRMLTMINRSLDLYKMETGSYELQPEPVDILAVLDKIKVGLTDLARRKDLSITVLFNGTPHEGAGDCFILGEDTLCYSLFANLIKNAIEASPSGHVISTNLTISPAGSAQIDVHNTGPVPDEVRDRFFEKYVTSGKRDGTGLGTYSAKLITEAMQGKISMRTEDDNGTTISVSLPSTSPVGLDQTDSSVSAAAVSGSDIPVRILVADDVEANRRIIKLYLRKSPAVIQEVENGEEAFKARKAWQHDIILMDMEMPVMNGLEAVEAIREWEKSNNMEPTPIIALTAHDQDEFRESCMTSGCNDFLTKPIQKERLVQMVKSFAQDNS